MYTPDSSIDITTTPGGPVTLAVDDRGGGDALPFVLVHGFTGGRIDFADVVDDLAADRRIVAWDHRGHSDSTNTGDPDTYTFDTLTADTLAAVDALGLDRFHLLGHSMGGIVAQKFVLANPARVASLVLMDTMGAPTDGIPQSMIDLVVSVGRGDGMGAVADLMENVTAGMSVAPEEDRARLVERNRHKLTNMDVEAFASFGNELGNFDVLIDAISSVTCPATVLVGELDAGLRDGAVALHEAIDGSELVVIDGAAHSPQVERPAEWLDAIRSHLARAEG